MSGIIDFLREYLTVSLVFVLFSTIFIEVFWKRRHLYYLSWLLDGPFSLPLIGNVLDFTFDGEKVFEEFVALTVKYGTLFRIWGGPYLIVFVSHPDDIKVITQHKNSQDKPFIYQFLDDWLGEGTLTAGAGHWHGRRKIMSQAFSVQMLDSYLPVFNEQCHVLVNEVRPHLNTNKYVDIFEYTTRFTLDTVSEVAFGIQLKSQQKNVETQQYDNDYAHATDVALQCMFQRMVRPHLYPRVAFLLSSLGRTYLKCVKVFNRTSDQAIAREQKNFNSSQMNNNTSQTRTMVGMLVQNNYKYQLSEKDMRDELNTMIAGGADTSSHSLAYALMLLAMHPEIQNRVYDEIKQNINDDETMVSKEHLNDMPYLEQVIKETLRLFPVFSAIARHIKGDVKLASQDITLKVGTIVMVGAYTVQRDKSVWGEDAEEFNPDRFAPENAIGRHPSSFMAFSAGARNCMGHKFAKTNMKVLMIHFLRKYRVRTEETFKDVKCEFNILTKNVGGWKIKIDDR